MNCSLCPRHCGADRSVRPGFCGLGEEMLIARIAPHLWEEPPISGSRGTGAVFFSGCTLRCVYCQNGDISHRNEGRFFTPQELSDALKRLTDLGVHTLSFITGTPFVPRILEALELWRPPLPLVWNTSGYETVDTLRRLEGVIDIYLPDLKHFSVRAGRLCAAAPDYFDVASAAPAHPSASCASTFPATVFPCRVWTAVSRRRNTAGSETICWRWTSPASCRNRIQPTGTLFRCSTKMKASYKSLFTIHNS